jgi:pimeloyl-ACP methyl ester carboxylesterase
LEPPEKLVRRRSGTLSTEVALRVYFEDMFPANEVRVCRERLEKMADLKQYTTSIAVEDLNDVRRALGYEKINLYGGSYGTTMVLAYLRQYRKHVLPVGLELHIQSHSEIMQ